MSVGSYTNNYISSKEIISQSKQKNLLGESTVKRIFQENILDFYYKTPKKFNISGLNITELDGESIKKYLETYSQNKKLEILSIYCYNCNLIKLEKLPIELTRLDCSYNNLTELNNLPDNLKYLICSFNNLNSLGNLPNRLVGLYCSNNENLRIVKVPESLIDLEISINQIDTNITFHKNLKIFFVFKDYWEYKSNIDKLRLLKINYKIYYRFFVKSENIKHPTVNNEKIFKVFKEQEGGKKNKIKVNIKKSELQKIAFKHNISLKKLDGTIKKKIELYKSLKNKKLI